MTSMTPLFTGVKIGAAVGGTMFAAGTIDGGNVSVEAAVGVCIFVGGCVWWLGKKFQKIDDKLDYLHKRLDGLPCDNCEWPNGKRRK